ncbi:SRPBCC family protein [Natrinema amylolyticum]|uniref:SRPBCC family protein n=1 Tax=Natrinema amylolyticum TaxID=2878679 RepID=UPI001CFA3CF8|nr:SRPBCC family protein [Natrinema amylolyticum]
MSDRSSETIPIESRGGESARPRSESGRSSGRGRRLATAAVGGMLVVAGLRRRSLGGAAMAIGGGWLVVRGVSGRRPLRDRATEMTGEPDESATGAAGGPVTVERSVTVGAPADELAAYWRDPERLTRIMGPVAEVTGAGEDRHHWEVQTPRGPNLTWETELTDGESEPDLRWETLEGAMIANEGSVRFRPAPGDRGTQVTLRWRFDPPGGTIGTALLERLGIVPETIAEKVLNRFKSLAETGEIPTLEENPSARGSGDLL